jgi:hypothetical protein
MNYKYLNKVVDQLVRETRMDHEEERLYTPFYSYIPFPPFPVRLYRLSFLLSSYRSPFTKHCKEVYGLNEKEIDYVWNGYREIVKDKING